MLWEHMLISGSAMDLSKWGREGIIVGRKIQGFHHRKYSVCLRRGKERNQITSPTKNEK